MRGQGRLTFLPCPGLACAMLGLLLAGACRTPSGPAVQADRFDVALTLSRDGSIRVDETIAVRALAGGLREFDRTVTADHMDGIQFETASMDGRRLAADDPSGLLSVVDGRRLRVRWHVNAAAGETHVLALSYRAAAVVGVQGRYGHLEWPAIPSERGYPIQASRLSLTIPPGASLYSGSGVAAAGWTVAQQPHSLTAERTGLSASESGTLIAEVSVDPAVVAEPRWQEAEAWQTELLPALVSGGLFILVIGAGVIWIVAWQYPRADLSLAVDRRAAIIALRRAGWICVWMSIVFALAAYFGLPGLGIWLQAIPGSIGVVGIGFMAAARVLR